MCHELVSGAVLGVCVCGAQSFVPLGATSDRDKESSRGSAALVRKEKDPVTKVPPAA